MAKSDIRLQQSPFGDGVYQTTVHIFDIDKDKLTNEKEEEQKSENVKEFDDSEDSQKSSKESGLPKKKKFTY